MMQVIDVYTDGKHTYFEYMEDETLKVIVRKIESRTIRFAGNFYEVRML